MSALPKDWAYSPALDAELKQYLLLAYLQRVQACFGEHKLYPHLSQLHEHLTELLRIRQELERIAEAGGEVSGFDPATGRAVHEPLQLDPWLGVVEQVIGMAVPGLREALAEGHALRGEIARRIQFAPVGLMPLKPSAGWLLLRSGRLAQAYRYEVALVCAADAEHDGLRRVRTRYVADYAMGLGATFERIKTDLLARHPDLPNPAVFAFETDLALPRIETYMPVAKQLLYEVIRQAA